MSILVLCLYYNSILVYGLRMGKGQLSIVFNARPVKEVLVDPAIPDSIKIKLKLIEEIRQFAFDSIGLIRNENYSTYFDQHGKRLMYVVTACEPFALKPHQWHFPVLGDVPYKGFFDLEKAKIESEKMKALGFDTDIGGASGWSTLGFFKDPVLSQMLNYGESDLAELIIHELTHGTIFIKNNIEYNENLASFIGFKGAIWFLENKYGENSKQLGDYLEAKKEEIVLDSFMLNCAHLLDSLYRNFPPNSDSKIKSDAKTKMFKSFVRKAEFLELKSDSLFPARFEKRILKSGNAFFMQYVRYGSQQHDFERDFESFEGDLRKFVEAMKLEHLKN